MKLVVSVENKRSADYVNLTATEAVVISSSTCACLRKDGERISASMTLPATSSTVLSTWNHQGLRPDSLSGMNRQSAPCQQPCHLPFEQIFGLARSETIWFV